MTGLAPETPLRFPAVRSELPPLERWRSFLERAYRANRFTNFGALSLELERLLNARWGSPASTSIAASSGTAALAAPLIAAGVEGAVLAPAFTFPATLSAIKMAGARPILLDVDAEHWCVAPRLFKAALHETKARAAIVVAPFGLKTDFREHAAIAEAEGALLIIDNAAGLGVARQHLETSASAFECYSLHATKPFGIGEGGAIFAHRSWTDKLRSALNFGLSAASPDALAGWGVNGKLSEFHAAVGLAVAENFDERLSRRRQLAQLYIEALGRYRDVRFRANAEDSAWQFFPILLPGPEAARAFCSAARVRGMEVRRYYRPSLTQLACVERFGECPVSEDLAQCMSCLPVYSNASEGEVEELLDIVIASLGDALG